VGNLTPPRRRQQQQQHASVLLSEVQQLIRIILHLSAAALLPGRHEAAEVVF
jgi:hypothetical protein